jgi:hypothetical protein
MLAGFAGINPMIATAPLEPISLSEKHERRVTGPTDEPLLAELPNHP